MSHRNVPWADVGWKCAKVRFIGGLAGNAPSGCYNDTGTAAEWVVVD